MLNSTFAVWAAARLGLTSRRLDDERGANLVEYMFLLVLIAIIVIIGLTLIGENVSSKFSTASVAAN